MRAPPGERDRAASDRVAEPLVRLAALPARDGSPSYEERTGELMRRAAPPEGLAAGDLDHVWERLMRRRRWPAPRVPASWTWMGWALALAVLGVSGGAVAAVTGAWSWPRMAWHQVRGSSSSASGAPRGRSVATAAPARGLAPPARAASSSAMPAPVPSVTPTPPAAQAPTSPPADRRRATVARVAGTLGVASPSSTAGPLPSPDPRPSVAAPLAPAPFAAAPPSARLAPRPADLALAEEGELLGRALARLRQAHDPAGAIADLDRYASRFPNGVLHREAQTARVDALLMAGRSADARRVLSELTLGGDARDRELRLIRAELGADSTPATALEDFRAVWAAHPAGVTGERSLWGMAACHARLGDETGTRATVELYLRRFPDGPHAAEAAARAPRRD